jgi:ribosomal protein L14E/L6E/L27E
MSDNDRPDHKSSFAASLRLSESEFSAELALIFGAGEKITAGRIAEVNAELRAGDIVLNISGRDRGRFYFVKSRDGETVYLTDGRTRKLDAAKKKSLKHVAFVSSPSYKTAENLRLLEVGELEAKKITNKQIRAALRDYYKTRTDLFGLQNEG